jgi:hypothetical protein
MVKARTRERTQRLPQSIVLILVCGHDFFNELPAGVKGNLPMLRAAWQDPDIKAAVYARHEAKPRPGRPWAETTFGK